MCIVMFVLQDSLWDSEVDVVVPDIASPALPSSAPPATLPTVATHNIDKDVSLDSTFPLNLCF